MEKEVSESERKLLVRKKYLANISEVVQRPYMDQKDLFTLIKNFFSEYLKLEYEFTYEELSTELNKIYIKQALKNDIDNFLYDISETQYFTDKDMEQADIKEYLGRLKSIVERLILEDITISNKKPSFFSKIFGKPGEKKTEKAIVSPKNLPPEIADARLPPPKTDVPKELKEDRRDVEMENMAYRQKMFEELKDVKNAESFPLSSQINIISDIPDIPKMPETIIKEQPAQKNKAKNIIETPPDKSKKQTEKLREKDPDFLVQKGYALIMEDNNPAIVKVRAHIEEAYVKISRNKPIDAKEAYLKALDAYHGLGLREKEKVYQAVFELFKELKSR